MNFDLSPQQALIVDTFSRFFDEHSSTERVRAALPGGFDASLWTGLADLGAFGIRVPEEAGGMGLGLLDAILVMEQAGRTLASGSLAETIVVARLLATLGGEGHAALLADILSGEKVPALALRDRQGCRHQWINGGSVADVVIARDGDSVLLIQHPVSGSRPANLASQPLARLDLSSGRESILCTGSDAVEAYEATLEEWKLLVAAALAGLSREAIRLACNYACERQQFGQPIGSFQSISHPLADLNVYADGARYAVWSAVCAIAERTPHAAAQVSMALWLNCDSATRAVAQSLHTFGGYGLTIDYDIHLFNLRAKAWPLVLGDPEQLLAECGQRLYHGAAPRLPDAGETGIDFDIGDAARALAHETREFFFTNLTPELRAKAHYSHEGHDPGLHRRLAEARLLFPDWPAELGGRNADPYAARACTSVWEEFGWTTHVQGTCNMVGKAMHLFGSDDLKRTALAGVASGEANCALGFSEPSSGSDVFAASTKATRDGDGWRIDGQKMFTSGANIADYVLLLARTDTTAHKHKGLTMFIVPLDSEGIEVRPVQTFQDELTNITYYDGVWIPDSYRLGEVGSGITVLVSAFETEHGVSFVNTHRQMLAAAEQYCRDTVRDGKPMIEDDAVCRRLSRVAANVLAATMLTHRSDWAKTQNNPDRTLGPSTKMFTSERYRTDASDLLDLLAPDSLSTEEGPAAFVNRCYRHSQVTTIYAGTTEVHRSMIAEKQLGLPRTRAR